MSQKVLPRLIKVPNTGKQPLAFGQSDYSVGSGATHNFANVPIPGAPGSNRLIIVEACTSASGTSDGNASLKLGGVEMPFVRHETSPGIYVKSISLGAMFVPSLTQADIDIAIAGSATKDIFSAMYSIYAMGADSETPVDVNGKVTSGAQSVTLVNLETVSGGGLLIATTGWSSATPFGCTGNGATPVLAMDYAKDPASVQTHFVSWSAIPTTSAIDEDFTLTYGRHVNSAIIAATFA